LTQEQEPHEDLEASVPGGIDPADVRALHRLIGACGVEIVPKGQSNKRSRSRRRRRRRDTSTESTDVSRRNSAAGSPEVGPEDKEDNELNEDGYESGGQNDRGTDDDQLSVWTL
jgi:hypothetical protein